MSKKYNRSRNREFQELAANINKAIIANDGLIGDQKEQVEMVYNLEKKFQYFIQNYKTTIEGEVHVTNTRSKDIDMRITRVVTGEVVESTDTPKIELLSDGAWSVNKRSKLNWKLSLKPGESKTVHRSALRSVGHQLVRPPSITRFAPVMKDEASEQRKTIAALYS